MKKKCIRCNEEKSSDEFYTKKKNKSQYTECKKCINTRNIARVTKN